MEFFYLPLLLTLLSTINFDVSREKETCMPKQKTGIIPELQTLLCRFSALSTTKLPSASRTSARLYAYAKCNSQWTFLLLTLAGDVQANPGPVKHPCGVCQRPVASNHRALLCDSCESWIHIKCGGVTPTQYRNYQENQDNQEPWSCQKCDKPEDNPSLSSMSSDSDSTCTDTPSGPPRLTLLTINSRSLKSTRKQNDLQEILLEHAPDILCITETHLDNTYKKAIPDSDFTYQTFRKDRNQNVGGVLVAVRDGIAAVIHEHETDAEAVTVKISPTNEPSFYVVCYYRPPSRETSSIDSSQEILTSIEENGNRASTNIILTGDLNLPDIEWHDCSLANQPQYGNSANKKLLDIVDQFGMQQMVTQETRLGHMLDLVLCTCPDLVQDTTTVPGMSDHLAVKTQLNMRAPSIKTGRRTLLKFCQADNEAISNDLSSFKDTFLAGDPMQRSVEENWALLKKAISDTVKEHVPRKTIKPHQKLPWVHLGIQKLIRRKKRAYKKAKTSKSDADWAKFLTTKRVQTGNRSGKGLLPLEHTRRPQEHKGPILIHQSPAKGHLVHPSAQVQWKDR